MLKVVIDTNVFISALYRGGKPLTILRNWKRKRFLLLISPEIIEEILKVVATGRLTLEKKKIEILKRAIRRDTVVLKSVHRVKVIKVDPTDNMFLECALTGKADYIISGDAHLLRLKKFRGIKIVNAAKFLQILTKESSKGKRN